MMHRITSIFALMKHLLCSLIICALILGCEVRKKPPTPVKEPAVKEANANPLTKEVVNNTEPTSPVRFIIGETGHTYPLLKDIRVSPRLDRPNIRVERDDNSLVLKIPLAKGEAIWGFGQRLDAFNLRGKKLETWTTDGWNALDTSYYAVPFFISSEGYGVFINSTGKLIFDIGKNNTNELVITIPDTGADLYVFEGDPSKVSQEYTELVGRPRSAPEWIFRPWISRNSYLGAYEVDYTVERMRKLGMPVGVVVLEAWEEQLHNFKFATHRYPDPKAWIARLKQDGVHVVCWLTSSVWENSLAYNEAKDRGYLVLNDDGSEHIVRWLENGRKIDFRKPGATEWWRDLHKPLVALGVDGFKTDGGEHMPDPYFHNEHTYRYQKAALDAFENSGRDGMTFARSASPLNAGLGAFWAGDQEAEWSRLKAVIRAGLSTALSGFPLWAHDIGAYTGNPSKELYIRWLQLGTLSPLMQFHGIDAREPWHFDQETIDICRFYFELREKLLPMLSELGQRSVSDGTPIMRPLIWHFPEDADAREIDDQFMLGPDLIIAPITEPVDQRDVYLPEGEWKDLWSGKNFTGPANFLHQSHLSRIPIFVRTESYGEYSKLAQSPPAIETAAVTIRLAGEKNERGIVPTLRYWKPDQSPERVYYDIQNNSPDNITLKVALTGPQGVEIKPGEPFLFSLASNQNQRLEFLVKPWRRTPANTYKLQFIAMNNSTRERIAGPSVGIVESPKWYVTGLFEGGVGSFQSLDGSAVDLNQVFTGKYANVFSWQAVPAKLMDSNGRIDLTELTGADGGSTTFLYTELDISVSGTYKILTGFGDSMDMWVNGKKIQSIQGHRNPLRDEDSVSIRLIRGIHKVLIRNSRDLSKPHFYFRMVD